ncbi:MAG: GerMN domain-containing protein [Lachnospiraceae bacterium]|nr:GerMN domain-containing protein [Lachnospiraceae bacterium]
MKSKVKRLKTFKIFTPIMCLLVLFAVPACSGNNDGHANSFFIYYINNEETGILAREYRTESDDIAMQVAELIFLLGTISEKLEYKSPLAGAFLLLDYEIANGRITLDFNDHYNNQPIITEILVRASIVRTLSQVNGIDNIIMTIRGEPLIDGTGNIVGPMNADMFIANVGNELNAYARTNLRLYFADENGESLKAVNRNDVVYHSNTAIEKLVMETLIGGPEETENYWATINPATRLLGVTTTDGTCYVNLDENFLQQLPGINGEMVIFSITNSLVELPNINRVRISINGETMVIFETMNLATVFERNLDIVD